MALNLALIGAGGMGSHWAEAIRRTAGLNLKAVADVRRSRREALASRFKNCEVESDWRAVVKRIGIHAVIVAVPHNLLAKISRAALRGGKHVLSEKPAALNSRELREVLEAAEKSGRVYMVNFKHRYHDAFIRAKRLVSQGAIGDILFIRALYGFGGRRHYSREWRFNKRVSGGGELLDQGTQMIDLARWFLGDFNQVAGLTQDLFWKPGIDDNAFVLMKNSREQIASIHVSWTQWKWIHSFEIFGTKGYLIIHGLGKKYGGPERLIIGRRHPQFLKPPTERVVIFRGDDIDALSRELKEFKAAIEGRHPITKTGEAMYEILKIIEKVYRQNEV